MTTQKYKLTLPHPNGSAQVITVPDDLQFSTFSLDKDLGEQPGWYAHYGLIHTHASSLRDAKAQALKDIMAAVEIDIREAIAKSGEKSTEDKIRAKVQLDEAVITARRELAAAERTAADAAVIKEAWYHRKEALIAVSANRRAEMNQQNSH